MHSILSSSEARSGVGNFGLRRHHHLMLILLFFTSTAQFGQHILKNPL